MSRRNGEAMEKKKFVRKPKTPSTKRRRGRATKLLSRLKTYDDWITGLDSERRALVEGLCSKEPQRFGSTLREFYDRFVGHVEELAMRELGRKGGKASAKSLTPEQRTARARKAGKARQAKARKVKGGAQ
jgi:hypothetical protein